MNNIKVYIASDHAGFKLKEILKDYLPKLGLGYEIFDMGPETYKEDDDYPDFVTPLAKKVAEEEGVFGIVIGGSGQGEAMCANRIKGVRAIVFYGQEDLEKESEVNGEKSADTFKIVELARKHNNANIISIGTRFVTEDEAKFAIELFLSTKFSNDERHIRRINKF